MRYQIQEVEGIGSAYRKKLVAAYISTTDDLLKCCCDANGRRNVAEMTGFSEAQLLKWVNLADLMRISGVGPQMSELLEAAGVDTVKELRNRNAATLAAKLDKINTTKKLTRIVPNEKTIANWIKQAKKLNPVITH